MAGSAAMGIGTWAMHFIGTLGFELPVAVTYGLTATLLSAVPLVFSSAVVFQVSTYEKISSAHAAY